MLSLYNVHSDSLRDFLVRVIGELTTRIWLYTVCTTEKCEYQLNQNQIKDILKNIKVIFFNYLIYLYVVYIYQR